MSCSTLGALVHLSPVPAGLSAYEVKFLKLPESPPKSAEDVELRVLRRVSSGECMSDTYGSFAFARAASLVDVVVFESGRGMIAASATGFATVAQHRAHHGRVRAARRTAP